MTSPDIRQPDADRRLRRGIGRLMRALLGLVLALGLVLGGLWLGFAGRPLQLPLWMVAQTEKSLNAWLQDRVRVSLGAVQLQIPRGAAPPQLSLQDLRLLPATGGGYIMLPEVEARFSGNALLHGRVEPTSIQIMGTQVGMMRNADGSLAVDFGEGDGAPASLAEFLARIDGLLALPALATLQNVEAQGLTFTLDDRRANRIWTIGDGRAILRRTESETQISLGLGLVGGGQADATAAMTFSINHGGGGARVSARVDNVAASDLAAQGPLLAWLGVLDAPISGDIHSELGGDGQISSLTGSLSIGAGVLQPTPGARALPLNAAQVTLSFDPIRQRLTTQHLEVDSPNLRVKAQAHADIMPDGSYITQIQMNEVQVDPEGVFEEPVRFSQGMADLRLRLDPFSIEIGQLALVEDGRHIRASGHVAAQTHGWNVALDMDLDRIQHDRLLALWPLELVPGTRNWLVNNVHQGEFFDVKAGLRLRPGHEPRIGLGYEFREGDVRYMPTLPPIKGGSGYALIEGQTYLTVVEDGYVDPPEGGRINVARSVFRVPDIATFPVLAEITLQTESSLTAALSLLDQPPFSFLTKAGMPVDLGEGRARLTTRIELPLIRNVKIADVTFDVEGELTEVRSDRLVKGRMLQADRLTLQADRQGIRIGGPGRLGQARFDAVWHLPLAAGIAQSQFIEGEVTLDQGLAAEFLGALGEGALTGAAKAAIRVDLTKGAPAHLRLTSDLRGSRLSLRDLGWSKATNARGALTLEARLSNPIAVERLALEAPGLRAEGQLQLSEAGALQQLQLSRLDLGEWLRATAVVRGQGAGKPLQVEVTGGQVDLRHLPAQGAGGAGAGPSRNGPQIKVALDRVRVNAGVSLQGVRGQMRGMNGGWDGQLTGSLNGQVPVSVQMVPGASGTGLRLRAQDGGGVLRAAGIFTKAHGGALDVVMTPNGGAGHYRGTVSLADFRVRDMPVLAELLNVISVVGLLEQLGSSGLAFNVASARFRMTPDAVELTEGQAVGASFGVSLEGVYRTARDQLDLQGVISPFYLLNGIGALLTRPGEGVMGFTYRIEGSAKAPDVSVNPFSVLAPAFFRDMFRRPAARIEE